MREWHCEKCRKLLGKVRDGRLHIRFSRGHQYIVSLPATATCRGCRTLNEIGAQEDFQHGEPTP